MCRLSVVIPFVDDPARFEDTLVSVLQNRPDDCEVVVVHSGPYEDPYELAGEVRFVATERRAGLIDAINVGCEKANAAILHLLQPGIVVDEGWTQAAMAWFDEQEIGAVAPFLLSENDPSRIVSAGLRYTSGGQRIIHGRHASVDTADGLLHEPIVAPTLPMGFYRRSLLLAAGGFSPAAGDFHADIDMGLTLKCLGYRCALEPESVALADPDAGQPQPSFSAGRCAERVFWRHGAEMGWLTSVCSHPVTVASGFVQEITRPRGYASLLGRLVACAERGSSSQQQIRVRNARECLERSRSRQKRQRPSADETGSEKAGRPLLGGLQAQRAA